MMKTLNRILAIGAFALLAGCGGSDNNTNGAAASSCPAGQSMTVQGCIASTQACTVPGTGVAGVSYNGQCIQTSTTATTGTTCAAGQVSTVSYGCVASTQTCMVPGTNQQGVYYNNTCTPINTGTYGTTCAAGQVNTSYGCVASTQTCIVPGSNQQGVYYNNQCVQIIQSYGYTGGQYPQYPQYPQQYPVNGGYNGGYMQGSCINVNTGYQGVQCLYPCPNMPGQVLFNGQCYGLVPNNNGYYNGSSYYYYRNGHRSYNYGYTGGFSVQIGAGF